MTDGKPRCDWALNSRLEREYHDREWGAPVADDCRLFEMLILEGAQAGLSWHTVLSRRAAYRAAFDNFKAEQVASYTEHDIGRLLCDTGIIRNRLKIAATIDNARCFLEIQKQFGSFNAYLWRFTDDKPVLNRWTRTEEVPARSPESDALARDLKRRGFKFVGATICYAYLQAVGRVNDHLVSCFRHREIERLATAG